MTHAPSPLVCEACGQSCVTVEPDAFSVPIVCDPCRASDTEPHDEIQPLFIPAPAVSPGQLELR